MNFSYKTRRLGLINNSIGVSLSFKAYLEDSDISYDMKDQALPFAPTSFTNDSMMLRVLQKAKFTFNVIAENPDECVQNYSNLLNLVRAIKPSYATVYDQYVPDPRNVTGYFFLTYYGLPLNRHTVPIHITGFSYAAIKDMGLVEIQNNLIPVGYKVTIDGKILLSFEETVNMIQGGTDVNSGLAGAAAASAAVSDTSPAPNPPAPAAANPPAPAPAASPPAPAAKAEKPAPKADKPAPKPAEAAAAAAPKPGKLTPQQTSELAGLSSDAAGKGSEAFYKDLAKGRGLPEYNKLTDEQKLAFQRVYHEAVSKGTISTTGQPPPPNPVDTPGSSQYDRGFKKYKKFLDDATRAAGGK